MDMNRDRRDKDWDRGKGTGTVAETNRARHAQLIKVVGGQY